ncbi:MAG: hypothetical protein MI863_09895 [Desulfobacterales bacterium]|nr:hypothetical protein [Desulfobacterales bacterium]
MPKTDIHIKKSLETTGNPYKEVHEWIDHPDHKDERHDITRVLEVAGMFEEKYGKEAAQEYVQHLADDLNGKLNHLVEDVQAMAEKIQTYFGAKK